MSTINRNKILDKAQKYVQQGKLAKAVEEYVRLIDDDPSDVDSQSVHVSSVGRRSYPAELVLIDIAIVSVDGVGGGGSAGVCGVRGAPQLHACG